MCAWWLQWGRSPKRAERDHGLDLPRERFLRFNGAALRRERRGLPALAAQGAKDTLQWGRSPKRAERRPTPARTPGSPVSFNGAALRRERRVPRTTQRSTSSSAASMGPLSVESGERPRDRAEARRRPASMGPLSEESGELAEVESDRGGPRTASMGPLSEESGEIDSMLATKAEFPELQWGRSPKRAESHAQDREG